MEQVNAIRLRRKREIEERGELNLKKHQKNLVGTLMDGGQKANIIATCTDSFNAIGPPIRVEPYTYYLTFIFTSKIVIWNFLLNFLRVP